MRSPRRGRQGVCTANVDSSPRRHANPIWPGRILDREDGWIAGWTRGAAWRPHGAEGTRLEDADTAVPDERGPLEQDEAIVEALAGG